MLIQKYKHFLFFNKLINEDSKSHQTPLLKKSEMFENIKYNQFNLNQVAAKRKSLQCNETVSLESNYMITNIIGSGATSFVFEGYQSNQSFIDAGKQIGNYTPSDCDKKVAIKWIKKIFYNDTYAHHILREIKLLRILRGHKNIVKLKTIMRPQNPNNFNDLFIVLEHCSQNLMKVISLNENTMTTRHIQYITYEMMKGIHYIHSKGIIHRDLKPLNILVTQNWEIKISDFGSANVRTQSINNDYIMTNYVTTKYYRAPELYFSYVGNYDQSVDMWSVGCIIAELFTKDIFIDADNEETYVKSLVTFMGLPDEKFMNQMSSKTAEFIKANAKSVERKTLKDLIPNAPSSAIDLISKLFRYDPKDRLTSQEVLRHPFLQTLFEMDKDKQIIEGREVKYFDFEFEQFTLQSQILKELILDEIIISNSRQARAENKQIRDHNQQGILESLYKKSKNQNYVDLSNLIPTNSTQNCDEFNSNLKKQVGIKSKDRNLSEDQISSDDDFYDLNENRMLPVNIQMRHYSEDYIKNNIQEKQNQMSKISTAEHSPSKQSRISDLGKIQNLKNNKITPKIKQMNDQKSQQYLSYNINNSNTTACSSKFSQRSTSSRKIQEKYSKPRQTNKGGLKMQINKNVKIIDSPPKNQDCNNNLGSRNATPTNNEKFIDSQSFSPPIKLVGRKLEYDQENNNNNNHAFFGIKPIFQ